MAIGISTTADVEIGSNGGWIESGNGVVNISGTGYSIDLHIQNLQLPFAVDDGATLSFKSGWCAYLANATAPTSYPSDAQSVIAGDNVSVVGNATDLPVIAGGTGAARIRVTNDLGNYTEEHYVKLSKIAYPFVLDADGSAASDVTTLSPIGETSILHQHTPSS